MKRLQDSVRILVIFLPCFYWPARVKMRPSKPPSAKLTEPWRPSLIARPAPLLARKGVANCGSSLPARKPASESHAPLSPPWMAPSTKVDAPFTGPWRVLLRARLYGESCPQPDSICHPVQPTGQPGDWKACMPPCTDTYQCLGGTWECNTDGQCVIPNEAACGQSTLDPCSFTGSDGVLHEGICSRPPPTTDGPPTQRDQLVCSPASRINRRHAIGLSVCVSLQNPRVLEGPGGVDYAVCVAPVCDGIEDCMGGMFGCEDQVCVLPSYTVCGEDPASCEDRWLEKPYRHLFIHGNVPSHMQSW